MCVCVCARVLSCLSSSLSPTHPPPPHTHTHAHTHTHIYTHTGGYIEVRPEGVHKGAFLDKVLAKMLEQGKQVDFVLSVGDDASDESMFTATEGGCVCVYVCVCMSIYS